MTFNYVKIDNMFYKGFPIYYKKPINTVMQKATEFNDMYIYYYQSSTEENIKLLGKFKEKGKINTKTPYCDYDYDVYEFDEGPIFCDKKYFIYCLPEIKQESEEKEKEMFQVPELYYEKEEFSVYYKVE